MYNRKVSLLSKKFTKAVSSALVLAVVVGTTLSAKAVTPEDVFDSSYYSKTYSDLSQEVGTDETALLNHYLQYGQKEQRVFTELIDLKKYREAYADLDAAFGDDWNAYLDHYVNYGIKEGRNSFGSFDARAYADRYPDLKEAFGYDVYALYMHYLTYGIKEGRNCHADLTGASTSSVNISSNNNGQNSGNQGNNNQGNTDPGNNNQGNNDQGNNNQGNNKEFLLSAQTHGTVVDPISGAPIPYATIKFVRVGSLYEPFASVSGNDPGQVTQGAGWYEVVANENGSYSIDNFPAGRYDISVNAPGYRPLNMSNYAIGSSISHFSMPTFNLLSADISGVNNVSGILKDAVTNQGIAGATLKFRSDWNNKTGDVLTTASTSENGCYTVPMSTGYYTIEFTKEGYSSLFVNVFSSGAAVSFDGSMQSASNNENTAQFRIVLTWGAIENGLDSHLVVPVSDPTGMRMGADVFYDNKICYDDHYKLMAYLDTDCITPYGSETITIFDLRDDNPYYYSVHDYNNWYNEAINASNENYATSTALSSSGANVKVYKGSTLVKEYNVPTDKIGTVWNVFKIVNGQVIDINDINSYPLSMFGDYSCFYGVITEDRLK